MGCHGLFLRNKSLPVTTSISITTDLKCSRLFDIGAHWSCVSLDTGIVGPFFFWRYIQIERVNDSYPLRHSVIFMIYVIRICSYRIWVYNRTACCAFRNVCWSLISTDSSVKSILHCVIYVFVVVSFLRYHTTPYHHYQGHFTAYICHQQHGSGWRSQSGEICCLGSF